MATCILPTIFEVSEYSDSCTPNSLPEVDTGTDSDFYDTDLETEEIANYGQKDNDKDKDSTPRAEDIYICKNVYLESCRVDYKKDWCKQEIVPQTRIVDSLASKTINLQYRSLGASHMTPLAKSLQNNMRVERLILDGCDIQAEGMQYLAEGLADNVTVQFLNLANNNLRYEGAKWVAYLLLKNKIIRHVILSGNKFGDDTAKFIGGIIEVNNSLTYLDLSHNEFREKGGQIIGAALGENYRLDTLRLGWNGLRNQGAVAIGQSLQYNDTLKVLDVNMNGFGYGGSLALKISLKENTTLRELDVSNNSINWKGAHLISQGLHHNIGLEILRIGKNSLTTTGCMDLVEAISHENSSLKLLDLQGVSVTDETELLAAAISSNREFRIQHGGVVRCPDTLGIREDKEPNHMAKLMKFIKSSMIRPLELLRDFDKTTKNSVSEDEFVKRMEKVGVPLHKFQMRELAREVCSQHGTDDVDYKKLSDAVTNQILRSRVNVYKERDEKKRLKAYNESILGSGLPALDIASKGHGRRTGSDASPLLTNRDGSLSDTQNITMTSFPSILDSLLVGKLATDEGIDMVDSTKSPTKLLLSRPLEDVSKKEKKKKKIKRKKGPLEHPEGGTCVEVYS
ncbi:leucine-rich repeat-containing protein 74B [Patella vulgata]|uniref:leucine-rich repeat-containing protein 74B n=1 Tax=Patella vulgata TaxID=6465 RepID=UPI00217FD307|nr:leucine-rich repeat-containing protein 74B [Patella vulgata]